MPCNFLDKRIVKYRLLEKLGGDGHAEDRAHARRTRKHVEGKLGSWEPGAVLSTPSQYLISISRNTLNLISIPEPPSFAHPKP